MRRPQESLSLLSELHIVRRQQQFGHLLCRNLDSTTLRGSGLLDRRDERVRITFGIGDLGQSANKSLRIVIDPVRRSLSREWANSVCRESTE